MSLLPAFRRSRVSTFLRRKSSAATRLGRARPRLEVLEDRRLPTAYVVNSLADGAPVADGQLTLREAITAASQNAAVGDAPAGSTGLDTITFAPGLAFGTVNLDQTQGPLFYGTGAGDLSISGPVTGNPAGLVVSGQDQTRVLQLGSFVGGAVQQFAVDHVSIDSLTMTRGQGNPVVFGPGAGFINAGMNVALTSVAVTRCFNPGSDVGGGGGILNSGTMTLTRCTVANNVVAVGTGGGIDSNGPLSLTLSRVVNNVASTDSGGGIANRGSTLTVRMSTIAGNRSRFPGGGAGLACTGGSLIVSRSTISGNRSDGTGGGLLIAGGSTATLVGCTVVENLSTFQGGGIRVDTSTASAAVTVVNCTIVHNADTSNMGDGAGGFSWGGSAPGSTLVVSNTIYAENNAGPSTIYQDFWVDPSVTAAYTANFSGVDPRLGLLQDNGGPTFTMAPLPGSPVIDAGSNSVATTTGKPGGPPLVRDQRGGRRIIDGDHNGSRTVDIGAVEFSPGPIHPLIAAPDAGSSPEVKVYDGLSGQIAYDFLAYAPGFGGGVRVAAGDVTADGVDDIITGAGPSGGPQVNLYDGATGTLLKAFFALSPAFTGGIFVAAGDINNDGFADVVVGADSGGGPAVAIFDGHSLALGTASALAAFLPYDPSFTGGVRVAAGDVNGDGFADVITGKGPGTAPRVKVFSGQGLSSASQALLFDFMAYATTFTGGVYVSSGDINGDGKADIVTGAGPGGGPAVNVFSGSTGAPIASFFAYGLTFAGGVRVGAADFNGDGIADIITGRGPGGEPTVKVFDGQTQAALNRFDAFDLAFTGGVFVGGA